MILGLTRSQSPKMHGGKEWTSWRVGGGEEDGNGPRLAVKGKVGWSRGLRSWRECFASEAKH